MMCKHKQRVALFGGAFNPPHLAHLYTVTYLLSRADIDAVWILPSHRHVFNKDMLPFEQRVELLEKLCAPFHQVSICQIEKEPHLSGRTFDTLEALSNRWPKVSFSLVIGSDNLNIANRWYNFDELSRRWRLIVMKRPGHELNETAAHFHNRCEFGPILPSISSQEIRSSLSSPLLERDWERPPLSWVPHSLREHVLSLYSPAQTRSIATEFTPENVLPSQLEPFVFIWGQGRCGASLSNALLTQGIRVETASVRQLLDQELSIEVERQILVALKAKLWLVTSKDHQIDLVASKLSELSLKLMPIHQLNEKKRFVAHCSGLTPREKLAPLRALGFNTGVFHPLLSIKSTNTPPSSFREAAFLILGERESQSLLISLAERIGGSPIIPSRLSSSLKEETFQAIYHAAAVIGANLTMVPLAMSSQLFESLDLNEPLSHRSLGLLFKSALRPYLSEEGFDANLIESKESELSIAQFRQMLTGPIARSDLETIKQHISALSQLNCAEKNAFKPILKLYIELTMLAAELLDHREIKGLIEEINQRSS